MELTTTVSTQSGGTEKSSAMASTITPFNHNATISSRTRSGTFSGFSNFDPGEERLMV
jgi:hypothetical protein